MKKIMCCLISFLLVLSLCACSEQSTFDLYELCERYNNISDEKTLDTKLFCKEENCNYFHSFINIGENSSAAVSAFADDKNRVTKVCVTVTPESASISSEVYDFSLKYISAFADMPLQEAENNLSAVSFSSQTELFTDAFSEYSDGNINFTLISSSAAFSIIAENTKSLNK